MSDQIVRVITSDGAVMASAITGKELVEHARQIHKTLPVATAALGRSLMGASMMGNQLKGDNDSLTLQIRGGGPLGMITCVSDSQGNVRGYVTNPFVDIPRKSQGKLDVGGALGVGVLSVIQDIGLKEPYVGQTELKTGEIGDDLTYYFASSEQVPSAVGLGVLMEKDNTVRQAGGFIVQLMPNAEEEVIEKLEKNLAQITSVTELLDQGYTPEMLLEKLLGDMDLEINEKVPTSFYCNCDKVRVGKVLISLGEKELQGMIDDGEPIELNCHFCNSNYNFSVDELKELLELARK